MSRFFIVPEPSNDNTDETNQYYSTSNGYYSRIATALEGIRATHNTIESHMDEIRDDIDRIRELADHPNGLGIRFVSPYSGLGTAILYHLYVNQAQILEDDEASPEEKAAALQKYQDVLNDLVSNFSSNSGGWG